MKISMVPNAGPHGETLYAITPLLSKGMGILVAPDAPEEAREYAKACLMERYKRERFAAPILNKLGL